MKPNLVTQFITILILLSLVNNCFSQQVSNPEAGQFVGSYYDKFFGAGPVLSMPLSNRDFIDNQSLRGVRFFYREIITDRVSAGFDFSYSAYDDYLPPKVYNNGLNAVYTDIYNSVEQYGLTLSGEYNFKPESKIMPYVGFGAGMSYSTYSIYYNIYSDNEKKWSSLIRPYTGVAYRFSDKSPWAIFTTFSLDHSFANAPDYDYKGFSSFNMQLGMVFLDW